tara:strand:- start:349 stop:618 length:270 start_codon:yes stop_codon:yes gene_type:complete
MTTERRGHFQFFTNKKDALAYKKYLENRYSENGKEYRVTKITLKNKNQFITFLNNLSCQENEGWDMFDSPLLEEEKLDLEFERKNREEL